MFYVLIEVAWIVPRQKLNTLELDAIRPTLPGIGLICTPVIINHLLNKLKREKKKIDHYNHMQQKKAKVITKEKKKMQVRWATWICLFLIIDLFVLSRHNFPYSIFSLWGFVPNLCSTFPSIATLPTKECNFLPKFLTDKKPCSVL